MIKVVIIDDEHGAIDILETLCAGHSERLEVVGTARKYVDAIELITETQPDLVLLDIEMPTGSGFDILKHFTVQGRLLFHVVFVSAFDQYALQAIKHQALDYILKPINQVEFNQMIAKVLSENHDRDTHGMAMTSLLKNGIPSKIGLPTAVGTRYVPSQEIVRIEADGSYARVVTVSGETIVVCRMLKDFEKNLDNTIFLRVHRAHLVNIAHVTSLNRDEGNYVLMSNDHQVPISRRDKDRVSEIINGQSRVV